MKAELQSQVDPVKERLIESLDKIQQWVESTEEFVIEQAPLVAQEILRMGRIQSVYEVVAWALVAVVSFFVCRKCIRSVTADPDSDAAPFYGVGAVLIGLVSGAASFAVLCSIQSALTPWFAPRLYILQEIGKLL